jgi:hypothetical protein
MLNPNRLLTTMAASALLMAVAGCKSDDGRVSESAQLVEGILSARTSTGAAAADIDHVLAALTELQGEADMQGSFKKYIAAVDVVEADDGRTQDRLADMNARRDAYLVRWEAGMAQVQNPSVRRGMEDRRNRVAARFNSLTDSARSLHEAYVPFVKDLRELQTAFSLDLTTAGIASLKPAIEDIKRDGAQLKRRLSAYEDELNDTIDKMSVPPVTVPTTAATQ